MSQVAGCNKLSDWKKTYTKMFELLFFYLFHKLLTPINQQRYILLFVSMYIYYLYVQWSKRR